MDDIVTVNNIKRAWGFLLDNIDYPVDWQYIREYNRIIGEGLVRDAGRLREYGVRIGGTGWVPEIPTVESPQERVRGILEESEGEDTAMLLFGKGRRNEHTDQHLVCASGDMFPSFDMDGKPAASYAEIGRRFDRRYRVRERKDDPFPPDMRGKNNPEREHGRKRVWHCSLAIKAGHGILTDQEWEAIIRDYLTRMNIIDGDDEQEGAFRFHDNTERELDAFGAQIFEALGINVEVRDDTYLPEMIGRWGYRFPSNEEFAAFSQSSLTDVDPTHDDPDDVVIEYYDRSYLLFKLYERAVIQHDYDAAPFVSDGVIDVDSFTSFYTSVRNRRMSRAGKVLEIHIAHILDARGIEYEAQAKTENGKKPDFLFPSQAAYEDPAFPEEQLRMLASKTSIKDRFRQVADEANRIRDKHLFTLTPGDVTHPKLAQLDELHIHLVMPKVVKESYDDLIQGRP